MSDPLSTFEERRQPSRYSWRRFVRVTYTRGDICLTVRPSRSNIKVMPGAWERRRSILWERLSIRWGRNHPDNRRWLFVHLMLGRWNYERCLYVELPGGFTFTVKAIHPRKRRNHR